MLHLLHIECYSTTLIVFQDLETSTSNRIIQYIEYLFLNIVGLNYVIRYEILFGK